MQKSFKNFNDQVLSGVLAHYCCSKSIKSHIFHSHYDTYIHSLCVTFSSNRNMACVLLLSTLCHHQTLFQNTLALANHHNTIRSTALIRISVYLVNVADVNKHKTATVLLIGKIKTSTSTSAPDQKTVL